MAGNDDLIARLRDAAVYKVGGYHNVFETCGEAATALAERDATIERLKTAIFGSANYDPALTIGCFVEMALSTERARQGALARATAAERERDEARAEVERKDAALQWVYDMRKKGCPLDISMKAYAALRPNGGDDVEG